MRVSFFFLVARCVCLCPDNFYKPPGENICIACPACALSQVTPCGGDSPGLCAAGLDVSLQISSADSLNASLLPNHTFFSARSDVFIQPVQAPGLLISLLASGAASLNATALLPYRANVTILPDTIVSASLVPCTQPNTFRSARTFQCLPCSNCSEYDVFVANCTPVQDTLCRGSIHLDYMVINPFDPDNTLPVQLDVQAIPCPSGQYRQRQTGICIPCSVCQQGAIPLVPCSLQDDTRCTSVLDVGLVMSGADYWSLSSTGLKYAFSDESEIVATLADCPEEFFRDENEICTPCIRCYEPYEREIRPCTQNSSRLCRSILDLDLTVWNSAGIDTSKLNQTRLKQILFEKFDHSFDNYSLDSQDLEVVSVVAKPLLCPDTAYLDVETLLCVACADCQPGEYMHTLCSPDSPPVCKPCTVCETYEHYERACTSRADASCSDELSISFAVDSPVAQGIQDILSSLLSNISFGQVDEGYLARWAQAHGGYNHLLTGLGDVETVNARYLNCSGGQYRDDLARLCRPCSTCPASHYQASNCTQTSDAACLPCSACAYNQYVFRPCGAYENTVCYNYATRSITMNISILSNYTSLFDAYIPGFITAMQIQLAAESILVKVAYVSQYLQNTNTYSFVVTFSNVFERVPNKEHEYSVVAERALLLVESILFNASISFSSRRLMQKLVPPTTPNRRLMQVEDADGFCEPDTYLYTLNAVRLCVSCVNDFNPLSAEDTPYFLRFYVANTPCPSQFARRCFGGLSPPICVQREGITGLSSAAGVQQSAPQCVDGQVVSWDENVGEPVCRGVPCGAGFTGPDGYCQPCPPGLKKDIIGPSPCEPCPPSMFTTDGRTCSKCPPNSTGTGASCTCDAGFYLPTPCVPCPPGTFRVEPLTTCTSCHAGSFAATSASPVCVPCQPGSYSLSQASACTACGPGSYQGNFGATECLPCAISTEPNMLKTGCVACGAGRFSPSPGVCGECLKGYVGTGQSCVICEPGLFADPTATLCLPCPAGNFALQGVCTECGLGRFSQQNASSTCLTCPLGQTTLYRTARSQQECVNCARGQYGVEGKGCVGCPGYTDSPPASKRKEDCLSLPGYYGAPGNAAIRCPKNHYCPAGAMAPVECPSGKTSDEGAWVCSVVVERRTEDLTILIPVGVICAVVCAVVLFILFKPKKKVEPRREIRLKIRR